MKAEVFYTNPSLNVKGNGFHISPEVYKLVSEHLRLAFSDANSHLASSKKDPRIYVDQNSPGMYVVIDDPKEKCLTVLSSDNPEERGLAELAKAFS